MKFSVFQVSRKGGREKNEDRMGYCYTRESGLFVMADGMGGHPEGEVAAQLALQTISALYQKEARPQVKDPTEFLSTVVGVAGNSGSVTVNAQGEVVGVLFGGVAGGAASQYVYEGALREPDRNTHSAAGLLIPMLRVIYRADRIADELNGAEVNP